MDLRYWTEVIRLSSKGPTRWAALPSAIWYFAFVCVCFLCALYFFLQIQFWKQAFCLLTPCHTEGLVFLTYLQCPFSVTSGSWAHVVQCVSPEAPWSLLLRLYCFRVVPWEVSLFTLVPSRDADGGWPKESKCPGQPSLLLRFYELVSPARGMGWMSDSHFLLLLKSIRSLLPRATFFERSVHTSNCFGLHSVKIHLWVSVYF